MMAHAIRWLALLIATATLFLASWIVVPAPTYSLIALGVGAREISAWLILASIIAAVLAVPSIGESRLAQVAVLVAAVSFVLAASPFARIPSTVARFDATVHAMSATPALPLRRRPLVVADLFRGIPRRPARVTRGVSFTSADGTAHTLDVYRPATNSTPHPIIVQIYGGAWQRGAPADNTNFAEWATNGGYVVFAIDYRHAPNVRWPVLLEDVDAALLWIRDHAREYGGDDARVVLMGRSAGGHLALMAAYSHPPIPVRGVISYYGPADLPSSYRDPPHPDPIDVRATMRTLMGGPLDQMPDAYAAASPISLATPNQPPTLLVYAGADKIVEAKWGARLRDALATSHVPVAYLEIPWANHAFDAVFNGPSSQLALYYTERFLAWTTARSESSP